MVFPSSPFGPLVPGLPKDGASHIRILFRIPSSSSYRVDREVQAVQEGQVVLKCDRFVVTLTLDTCTCGKKTVPVPGGGVVPGGDASP